VKIASDALREIAAHARRSRPRECCGILLGSPRDPDRVCRALPAANAERHCPESAYVLGHTAHIRAVAMEAAGTHRIAGYYHSHPGGSAAPSSEDAHRALPGTVYLIAAVEGRALRYGAWRREGGRFVPLPLEVLP
jgi:proteasome lid subunit RPN8/RPN11